VGGVRLGTFLIVAIAVVAVLGLGLGAFILLRRPPPTVDQQVAALVAGGRVIDAGKLLDENGRSQDAIQLFLQHRMLREAGKIMIRSGDYMKAAEIFSGLGDPETAANCFLKAGNRKAAALEYRKAGQLDLAATSLYQMGEREEAAKVFIEARQPQKAAAIFAELGQKKVAAALMGAWHASNGDFKNAAKSFVAAGKVQEAAAACTRAGLHDKAAALFEKIGEFQKAADAYTQAGNHEAAANHFERLGNMKAAIPLFEAAGKWNKVVECHKREKNWLALGNIMMRLEKSDLAIEFFKRLTPLDDGYMEAAMSMASILENLGDIAGATAKYKEILEFKGLSVGTSQALFGLCTLCEKSGSPDVPLQYLRQFSASGAVGEKVAGWITRFEQMVISAAQTMAVRIEVANEDVPAPEQEPAKQEISLPPTRTALADRYEVVDKIGQGGHGVIYKAFDKLLGREVVLKFLFRNQVPSEMARRYFLREAKTTASLNHPNIVTLYDMGQIGENLYIAMEFIKGITLEDYLRDHADALDMSELLSIIEQLCSALQYAHDRHIIHRDIKPGNVMLTGPDQKVVKLMDFGLAKALDDNPHKTQIICGTPLYMSPEQILGDFVDHVSDIYSLGILVFQLFTGRTPFPSANILAHQQFTAPPHPTTVNRRVPLALGDVMIKCLEKKREKRFQSASEFASALRRAAESVGRGPAFDQALVAGGMDSAADGDEQIIPLDI